LRSIPVGTTVWHFEDILYAWQRARAQIITPGGPHFPVPRKPHALNHLAAQDSFFSNPMKRIEHQYERHDKMPVVLLCHSMAC
jgi:hypothetical protein